MPVKNEFLEDRIVLQGRAGLLYYDKKGKCYLLDSELVASNEYDYAIYIDSIVEIDNDTVPEKAEKEQILKRVQYLCELRNMKPRFFKDNI